jgi:hypothetical protein
MVVKKYIDTIFSEKTGRKYDISLKDYQDLLYKVLIEIGKVYASESEWVVKGDVLNIPKNSFLYVLTPTVEDFNEKLYNELKN